MTDEIVKSKRMKLSIMFLEKDDDRFTWDMELSNEEYDKLEHKATTEGTTLFQAIKQLIKDHVCKVGTMIEHTVDGKSNKQDQHLGDREKVKRIDRQA